MLSVGLLSFRRWHLQAGQIGVERIDVVILICGEYKYEENRSSIHTARFVNDKAWASCAI